MILDQFIEINTNNILYNSLNKSNNIIYADWVATGKPSNLIENILINNIYPYYTNPHSNSEYGILMKKYIESTKKLIRKYYNVANDQIILFTGNGCTGAINYLIQTIEFNIYDYIYIYISVYEHHSNYLPWIIIINKYKYIKLIIIPLKSNSEKLDFNYFFNSLQNITYNEKTLIICSFIAASNVNGYILPLNDIKTILNNFVLNTKINTLFFSDYACSAPYVKINASNFDAIFISPHKMVGGPQTPGILIANKCLFTKSYPIFPGGGCVNKANSSFIEYSSNLEMRESGGTPNVIGIIRLGLVILLNKKYINLIKYNDKILFKLIRFEIDRLSSKYNNFKTILYNKSNNHLPILSFSINELNCNLISTILYEKFSIQTRSGISCAGLLAEYCEKFYNIKGWCRVSFHWTMTKQDIIYIFKSIEDIIMNVNEYIYSFTKSNNVYN